LNILLGIILIIAALRISLAFVFFLAQKFFGGTKEEEWFGLKRSIAGML